MTESFETLHLTEDQLSKEVRESLSSMAKESQFNGKIEVLEKQQVLMNLTIGRDPKSSHWRYYMGMQQQDIVVYLSDKLDSVEMIPSPAQYHWASTGQRKANRIRIPLLI